MRILDRYILREYLIILLIIIFSFSVLFLVIDISDRLPRLLRNEAEFEDIMFYFLLRIPYLIILSSPVMVLLSGLFLMDRLSKYSESIAIRAAGISILRMVAPLIIFGFIFSMIMMYLGDRLLPKAEDMRNFIFTEKIKNMKVEDKKLRSHIHYVGKDNNLYYIGFFDGYRNLLKTIDITAYEPGTGAIRKKIIATDAEWMNDKWVFKNCNIRLYEHSQLLETQFWDEKTIEEVDVTPIDFIKSAKKPLSMNFSELKDYIQRLQKVGENYQTELVELYLKISFPFANLIILLFSIPLVSTSSRSRSRGLIFGLGLLVCFLYLSLLRICQSLGYNGMLSPIAAAWLPNIFFATIGVFFVIKAEV